MEVTRILITGGISSGKTRALDWLRKKYQGRATFVPEGATLLLAHGYPPPSSKKEIYDFQNAVIKKQKVLTDIFERINATQNLPLIFYDRSPIDIASFWPDGPQEFYKTHNVDPQREAGRYAAIICLQTVATIDEYNRDENNKVRFHNKEEAIANDQLVKKLYQGFENVYFLSASETFEKKFQLIEKIVERFV